MNEENSDQRKHRHQQRALPDIARSKQKEIWWDKVISTPGKVAHNRPDTVFLGDGHQTVQNQRHLCFP